MPQSSALEDRKRREKIHRVCWEHVGAAGFISLPMLKGAISDEFGDAANRFILTQMKLMQAERRIRIDVKFQVWVKEPRTSEIKEN